jgi:hypothetical protein
MTGMVRKRREAEGYIRGMGALEVDCRVTGRITLGNRWWWSNDQV